jgi:hypothetical protein
LNTLIALLKVPEEEKDNEGEQENNEGDYDSDDEGERHVANKRRHCTSTSPMKSKRRRLAEDDGESNADNRSELSLDDDYECEDDRQDVKTQPTSKSILAYGKDIISMLSLRRKPVSSCLQILS